MRTPPARILIFITALLLSACASSPFNKAGLREVDRTIDYVQAVQNSDALRNRPVLFGGSIIDTRNLPDRTELVVLAYPLNNWDRPNTSATPLGRFIAVHSGYLESVDYAPGRLISVRGYLDGAREEPLAQSNYVYPVMRVEELHLWPAQTPAPSYPRFQIGVGVFGDNVGGSVGFPIP